MSNISPHSISQCTVTSAENWLYRSFNNIPETSLLQPTRRVLMISCTFSVLIAMTYLENIDDLLYFFRAMTYLENFNDLLYFFRATTYLESFDDLLYFFCFDCYDLPGEFWWSVVLVLRPTWRVLMISCTFSIFIITVTYLESFDDLLYFFRFQQPPGQVSFHTCRHSVKARFHFWIIRLQNKINFWRKS